MSKSELMKNKLNECDMFVELTIPTFIMYCLFGWDF